MEWEQWYVENTITDMFHVNIKGQFSNLFNFFGSYCVYDYQWVINTTGILKKQSQGAIGMQTFKYVLNNYKCDD